MQDPPPGEGGPGMPLHNISNRQELVSFLKNKCVDIRKMIVQLTVTAGGGHVGGALSMTEMLVVLYQHIMNIEPSNPKKPDRDRLILSKGHGGVGICPVLCDAGYFPKSEMDGFNQFLSPFGMHPDMNKVKGIDMSTGSLGHGLSICVGLGLAARLDKASWRAFCVLGDGECNEGSVWEAAMSAKHYKLGNVVALVDKNKFMIDGPVEQIMSIEPFEEKWKAFGWKTTVIDGHSIEQLLDTLENLDPPDSQTPQCIICNTVKGRGVSFMEGQGKWHYGGLDELLEKQALEDIEKTR